MKKLIALVLALALVLLCATAFAGTIKIDRDASYDGTGARTYTAYKVFDADTAVTAGTNTTTDTATITYGSDAVSYSVANNSPWLTALNAPGQTWFDINDAADGSKKIVTLKSTVTNNTATAQEIAAYFAANIPSGLTGTTITPGDGTQTATTVDNGYYIIVASDGATNLTLVTGNVNIHEKNTYITTSKTVSETSYNVGDTVTYTATVYVPLDTKLTPTANATDADYIILHDTMSSVLNFSEDATATVDGASFTAFTASYDDTDGWTIPSSETFQIKIPVTSDLLNKTITFTYHAVVNESAATDTGFVNTLFGEKNGYRTNPDDVKVYTFDFPFKKLFVGSTATTLTATFELRTDADDSTSAIAFAAKANGKQEKALTGGNTTITITNGEQIDLVGLAAGTYFLVETGTSTGYNLLSGPVTVVITDTTDKSAANWTPSHSVTTTGGSMNNGVIEIENNSGTVLPSTGGIGTTIFYILGGLLVIGAAVILVARRKAQD